MAISIRSRSETRRPNFDESIDTLVAQMKDHNYPMKDRIITLRVPILLYSPITHTYQTWKDVSWTLEDLVPNDARTIRKILTKLFRIVSRIDLEHVQTHLDEWLATINNP